jgi:hypothetical protein
MDDFIPPLCLVYLSRNWEVGVDLWAWLFMDDFIPPLCLVYLRNFQAFTRHGSLSSVMARLL